MKNEIKIGDVVAYCDYDKNVKLVVLYVIESVVAGACKVKILYTIESFSDTYSAVAWLPWDCLKKVV